MRWLWKVEMAGRLIMDRQTTHAQAVEQKPAALISYGSVKAPTTMDGTDPAAALSGVLVAAVIRRVIRKARVQFYPDFRAGFASTARVSGGVRTESLVTQSGPHPLRPRADAGSQHWRTSGDDLGQKHGYQNICKWCGELAVCHVENVLGKRCAWLSSSWLAIFARPRDRESPATDGRARTVAVRRVANPPRLGSQAGKWHADELCTGASEERATPLR